jgi:hypothetical protein
MSKNGFYIGSLLLLLLLLSSCSNQCLVVDNRYVGYKQLASYKINTADWRKDCPDSGQRLLIKWKLPLSELKQGPLSLYLYVHFGDRDSETVSLMITKPEGLLIYDLLNEEYFSRDGILTYKVEILDDEGCVSHQWQHQVWTELINIGK